jgi:RNA polymerase sporulation-specific sigma factor
LGLDDADAETIAKELNIPIEKAMYVLNYSPTYRSMSETVFKDEGSREDITLEDTLSDDSFEDSVVDNYVLEEFMSTLSERERAIWTLYHKENYNQVDVGKMFGISQVQVSRILSKIEKKAEAFGKKKGYSKS